MQQHGQSESITLNHANEVQLHCRTTSITKPSTLRRDLKTFLFSFCLQARTDYVMHPRSSRRGRNTSASVTVTVTVWVNSPVQLPFLPSLPSFLYSQLSSVQPLNNTWCILGRKKVLLREQF